MRKQDKIILNDQQRKQLHEIISKGEHKAHVIRNAQIILKSAEGWTDAQCAEAFNVHKRTVIRTRQAFLEEQDNLLVALNHKPRSGAPVKFKTKAQALVIAKACTPPPEGYQRWTLSLLSREVSLEFEAEIPSISRETVRRLLKKLNLNLTEKSNGVSLKLTPAM